VKAQNELVPPSTLRRDRRAQQPLSDCKIKVTQHGQAFKGVPPRDCSLISGRIAATIAGVSLPTFKGWEAAGLIKRVKLPGNIRRCLYLQADVRALCERLAGRS